MDTEHAAALVRRAREGDDEAWAELHAEFSGLLWGIARRFRLDESQRADAVQTTWMRLVEHLDDIRDPGCLPGWLATTVRRSCTAQVHSSRREAPVDVLDDRPADDWRGSADPVHADPVHVVVRSEEHAMVRRVVADLPERHQRLVAMLYALPGAHYQDISEALGMPVGSIGPTRARILRRLRESLQERELVS
jgi:RNA polymerase sigma factor (sigma-70 family)